MAKNVNKIPSGQVHHVFEFINEEEKVDRMIDLLRSMTPHDKILIFVKSPAQAVDLTSTLVVANINCQSAYEVKNQWENEEAFDNFQRGIIRVLLATEVALKGRNVTRVNWILHYSIPQSVEEYVHRMGRLGCAGKRGQSITLFTRSDWSSARELMSILKEVNQEIPEELRKMADRYDAWFARKKEQNERARVYGGGMGGGKNNCYNCSKYGHISRFCLEPRRRCYNCHHSGHMSRDCPEPRLGGGGRVGGDGRGGRGGGD